MSISTAFFEGELDAFVELVRQGQIPIHDVLLSSVTTQLLEHAGELPVLVVADQMVLASWLVKMKTAVLIGTARHPDEDDISDVAGAAEEERFALLGELALIKELVSRAQERDESFLADDQIADGAEDLAPADVEQSDLDEGVTLDELAAELETVAAFLPEIDEYREEDLRNEILALVAIEQITFARFIGKDRRRTITAFLALLELVRQRAVRALQEEQLGIITIKAA